MSEDNKAVVRRYIEEAYNKGNVSVVEETFARDILQHWVQHGVPDERGLDAKKATPTRLRRVFPDLHLVSEAMIAEGDMVAHRWTFTGTHRGESATPFGTLPPTGNHVKAQGITIFRLSHGKIVEEWSCSDRLGRWEQMGGPKPSEIIAKAARK
jgi:predicted ester cyclase